MLLLMSMRSNLPLFFILFFTIPINLHYLHYFIVEPNSVDEKRNLQIELLKLQIYKTKLDCRMKDIEMGLTQSGYTAVIKPIVGYS